MRGLICGPKLAACGMVLSTWGVIMLAMLGIFFTTHSAVLIEDVPLTEKDIEQNNIQRIYDLYNKVGYNCFIAAAVYVLFGALSCCQMRLNKQKVISFIWLFSL
ncbi:ribonuclease kappa-A-like [Morone saxatilis]|uniref:ribonuclease kappa-A-like n=1 Tax=Morone saxatilis TaxID=34816 RepID=UPI0015E1D7E3|nr:ribonuclease kappa-A-like [Morone saxatilis]